MSDANLLFLDRQINTSRQSQYRHAPQTTALGRPGPGREWGSSSCLSQPVSVPES